MTPTNQKIEANTLDTGGLFRMPWTNSDNAFSWLEITRRCNLDCGYCYQTNRPDSDKRLARIESEIDTLLRLRKTDTIFISGGEPLLHPHLARVVELVAARGAKPVLVTNGHRFNFSTAGELKRAGLFGVVFHVDSGQSRPDWIGASEAALNALRQRYTDTAHKTGLVVGFNTTILPETLHEVPEIIRWTTKNIHKVSTNTLIPVRVPREDDPWELSAGGRKIAFEQTAFSSKKYKNPLGINLTAKDIFEQTIKVLPHLKASAFLGGTEVPDAPKWLFCNVIGTDRQIFGNLGPKGMETLQNGYHFFKGRFLSFLKPVFYGMAKWIFPLGLIDKELRRTVASFLAAALKNPLRLFKKVSIQSLLILQPQDVLTSGRQDLCDGCPNKTIHEGQLISMCRVEEYISFGDMVTLRAKPEQEDRSNHEEAACACNA